MKVIYVAGPFRASAGRDIRENVVRARGVGVAILERSDAFSVVVPHLLGLPLSTGVWKDEVDYWLPATLELMRRCDGVVMVPGWEQSTGSKSEREEAIRLGLPVFESVEELLAYEWIPTILGYEP